MHNYVVCDKLSPQPKYGVYGSGESNGTYGTWAKTKTGKRGKYIQYHGEVRDAKDFIDNVFPRLIDGKWYWIRLTPKPIVLETSVPPTA